MILKKYFDANILPSTPFEEMFNKQEDRNHNDHNHLPCQHHQKVGNLLPMMMKMVVSHWEKWNQYLDFYAKEIAQGVIDNMHWPML